MIVLPRDGCLIGFEQTLVPQDAPYEVGQAKTKWVNSGEIPELVRNGNAFQRKASPIPKLDS